MGQCFSSTRHEGLRNARTSRETYVVQNSRAERKRSTPSNRKSGDGELSTVSTQKSWDRELSTTSTRRSVDGFKPSTMSSRKSVDGKRATTSIPKSGGRRASNTSTRTSGVQERPPTASIWTSLHRKLRGMLSGTSGGASTRKSVVLKPSFTSTWTSVEGKPGSSTSTRKSVDVKLSPIPATRKSVQDKPSSSTAARKSVDLKPSPTSTRKSVQGKPDSSTSTDRKRSTVSRKADSRFSAQSNNSELLRGVHRHEYVDSTEQTQKLGWYLAQKTRRDSVDHGKWRSRDSPVTALATSSSERDDHPRSSLRYEPAEWRSLETESVGTYHGKSETRSRDRRYIDRTSIDTISADMKLTDSRNSMERIDSKLVVEGTSTEEKRRWIERNGVESTIDDEMDLKDLSPLDIIRGFTSADQNSNGFKAAKSRNQYFTRSGSSPARFTYLPEPGERSPDDLDFVAQRFHIDNREKRSQALRNGRSVIAGQIARTDTQASTQASSNFAQERDEIKRSYRKSASRAASLDLNAFKSKAVTMVATS